MSTEVTDEEIKEVLLKELRESLELNDVAASTSNSCLNCVNIAQKILIFPVKMISEES